MSTFSLVIWTMVICQMLSWGWFSYRGGKLSDNKFLIFTAMMMTGQVGAGIETFFSQSWATFAVQAYFLVFAALGGIQRWREMNRKETSC